MKIDGWLVQFKESIGSDNVRTFGPNTAWMLAERCLRILASFFVGIYLARSLGPARFGLWSFVLGFVGMLTPICHLGLEPLVIKALIKEPENHDEILGTAFGLRMAGVALMYGLLILAAIFWLKPEAKWLVLLCGAAALAFPFQVIECHFQALVRVWRSVLVQMAQCVLGAFLVLWGIRRGSPLGYFAQIEIVIMVALVGGWLAAYRSAGNLVSKWRFGARRWKGLLWSTLPLALTGFLATVYGRTDHLMIERILGVKSLGWYAVPVRLTEACYFIPALITNSVYPGLVRASVTNTDNYERRLSQMYFILFWLMVAASACLCLLSDPLVHFLYGDAYAPSAALLRIYCWNAVTAAVIAILIKWLVNEGHYLFCFIGYALGLALDVALLVLALGRLGPTGAALASLVSLPLGMGLTLACSREGRRHMAIICRSVVTLPI